MNLISVSILLAAAAVAILNGIETKNVSHIAAQKDANLSHKMAYKTSSLPNLSHTYFETPVNSNLERPQQDDRIKMHKINFKLPKKSYKLKGTNEQDNFNKKTGNNKKIKRQTLLETETDILEEIKLQEEKLLRHIEDFEDKTMAELELKIRDIQADKQHINGVLKKLETKYDIINKTTTKNAAMDENFDGYLNDEFNFDSNMDKPQKENVDIITQDDYDKINYDNNEENAIQINAKIAEVEVKKSNENINQFEELLFENSDKDKVYLKNDEAQDTSEEILEGKLSRKNSVIERFESPNEPFNLPALTIYKKLSSTTTTTTISFISTDLVNTSEVNDNNSSPINDTMSEDEYLAQVRDFIFPKTWTWVLIFFHSVVFVIGIVGNVLVCVSVYRNHTMRTVTNYFIVNLALADFLVIFICLPPTVIWDVTSTWFFGVTMCKVTLYLQTVSVTVSVLTLTFISIDRWYAICFPLKFKSTTGRAKTAIAIIWLLALTFDIPEAVVYQTVSRQMQYETIYFTQCEPTWSLDTDTTWTIMKMFLLYAVPLLFMTITYWQIIKVLWKSGNANHICSGRNQTMAINTNTSVEGQIRSRIKAAKMLVVVVVMFAVCYFPVHLLSVLRLTVGMTNSETNRAFALISHWLCYANSAVNPIIYNFMSGKFRKEFRRAFDCCSSNTSSSDYELNSVYLKHTIKESGRSTNSRSCKRTLVEIRTSEDFRYNRRSTKTSICRMDV